MWRRVAGPIKELDLREVGPEFPLDGVLQACSSLLRLELCVDGGQDAFQSHLDCVARHASKITELKLDEVYRLGGCSQALFTHGQDRRNSFIHSGPWAVQLVQAFALDKLDSPDRYVLITRFQLGPNFIQ